MTTPLHKALNGAALAGAAVLIIVAFSAFHARRMCDQTMSAEVAPPPRYNTRFVLHPDRHMDGMADTGFNPGWVVIYAPRNTTYGTAFFVTFFGKILARGTPTVVRSRHAQDQMSLESFRQNFAQLDAAVPVGTTFRNAVSVLGPHFFAHTNRDGSVFSAAFTYMPRSLAPVDWLTNGFVLVVSNGIVVQKDYSYTSLR